VGTILLHGLLSLTAPYAWSEPLLRALPYARRLDLERRAPEMRVASLAGVALALFGASRVRLRTALARDLRFPNKGKPVLAGGPRFSVSHSDRHVACLVSDEVDPGLDLEARTERIEAGRLDRWCRSEATLKAAGLRLQDLDRVEHDEASHTACVAGRRYHLVEVDNVRDHVCYVALAHPCELTVEELDLAGEELSAALERSLGIAA
jgi:phosphopantetheinyl transferase